MLLPCLLVVCALATLPPALAQAAGSRMSCSHSATGDLVGHELVTKLVKLQPAGRREYLYHVPVLAGCMRNGVSVKACDLYAPQVEIGEDGSVRMRRLGPRRRVPTLQVTLFCDGLHSPSTE